jgi:uncharacterized membrane protein
MRPARQPALDVLRGLVMVIMALDHVRDFFHNSAQLFSPEDLTRTTVPIFLTRWITHFCAPVFMLTAGASAWLWQSTKAATPRERTVFLLSRGLWLVLLDFTVLHIGMDFVLRIPLVILNVLWALGWSMVILAALSHLLPRALAALSVAVIALHNLTDPVRDGWIWTFLHRPGAIVLGKYTVIVSYEVIPWFAVMALGYSLGPLFRLDNVRRAQWFYRIGAAATAAFLLLRTLNVYGDPFPWRHTVLSFLRTTKYPPSLEFLLMTLGPALMLWAWLERHNAARFKPLIVIGRVPLFYFIGHFYLAHMLAVLMAWMRYGHAAFALGPMPSMGAPPELFPPGFGYTLPQVYLLWFAVVWIMYPACRWYGRYKLQHSYWWLRYL